MLAMILPTTTLYELHHVLESYEMRKFQGNLTTECRHWRER